MATTPPDIPITMKVYDQSGNFISEFPYFTSLMVQDTLNDVGSFTFNFNYNSPGASNLISDSALQMAVCMDFRDGNGFTEVWRGFYEQDTYDPANNESAVIQASGRSMASILAQAVVYPQAGVGSTTTTWSFTGASIGTIMNTLITAAKTRGCFPALTTSFTNGADSSGNAWTVGITNAFSAGTSYLDLLTGLAQAGYCDFNMTGTTLNIYNPLTTLAADKSSTVVLRRARDIVTISAQRDRTQISTAMLAVGDNGANVEVTASTLGTLGRYETYLAETGITDHTTLTVLADQAIAAHQDQKLSYTPTDVFNVALGSNRPWLDFSPGNYISIDYAGTPQKFRATSWTLQGGPGGPVVFQPTLNDVFYSREVILQNRLNGITNGTITAPGGVAVTGSGGAPLPGPNPTVPNNPTFQTASCYTSAYYSPATGTTLAQLELQWTTPTNTNGTVMIDGANYLVQYKLSTTPIYPVFWTQLQGKAWSTINGNPWTNPLATPQNTQWTTVQVSIDNNNVIIGGLICGETYDFQIACTDVSGNTSVFSSITAFATATDNVAPGQPDAPQVSASMVAVQVIHDLNLEAGGPLPQDLNHLEVHYSYDPSFTPIPGVGSNTYLGKVHATAGMINAGIAAMGNFNVTNTNGIYIKVIAVDESGNSSPASPGSGVTAVLIDDTHISSLQVSKLLAGTVSAAIIIGSTISTASTGARVTLDGVNDAFEVYDTNGIIVTKMNASGFSMYDAGSNTIANWNHGGLTIYNGPRTGSIILSGSVSADLSPFMYWDTGMGFSSGKTTFYVIGQAAWEELVIQGPTSLAATDSAQSNVNLNINGGSGKDKAYFNFQYGTQTTFTGNFENLIGANIENAYCQQAIGGSGTNLMAGSIVQNTDLGTGIYPHFMNMGVIQISTDVNGNGSITHNLGMTPQGGVVGFYGGGGGTGYQYAWIGGSPFTSTTGAINIKGPTGANIANTTVNLYYIFWA